MQGADDLLSQLRGGTRARQLLLSIQMLVSRVGQIVSGAAGPLVSFWAQSNRALVLVGGYWVHGSLLPQQRP